LAKTYNTTVADLEKLNPEIVKEGLKIGGTIKIPSKSDKSAQLIDEAADFQDAMLSKINKAKGKAEFRAIATEVEAKAVYFVDALNGLNK
jgi:LysM repeat protein